MTAATESKRLGRQTGKPAQEDNDRRGGGGWLLAVMVVALAVYLLFCHGCHGDVDDELFVRPLLKMTR
jgi:hypothetical protein